MFKSELNIPVVQTRPSIKVKQKAVEEFTRTIPESKNIIQKTTDKGEELEVRGEGEEELVEEEAHKAVGEHNREVGTHSGTKLLLINMFAKHKKGVGEDKKYNLINDSGGKRMARE